MKQNWKPGTVLYPLPAVLVSCGATPEEYNLLTVAWTGTVCSESADVLYFGAARTPLLRHHPPHGRVRHQPHDAPAGPCRGLVRVRSGRDYDKFREMGLTAVASEKVAAPLLAESPVNIECRVRQVVPLGSPRPLHRRGGGGAGRRGADRSGNGPFLPERPIRSSIPTGSISSWAKRWGTSAGLLLFGLAAAAQDFKITHGPWSLRRDPGSASRSSGPPANRPFSLEVEVAPDDKRSFYAQGAYALPPDRRGPELGR